MSGRLFAAQARRLCPESDEWHDAVWFCETCRMLEMRLTPVTQVLQDLIEDANLTLTVPALPDISSELYRPERLNYSARSGKVVHVSQTRTEVMNLNEARWGILIATIGVVLQTIQVIQNRKPKPRKRPKRRRGRHRKR